MRKINLLYLLSYPIVNIIMNMNIEEHFQLPIYYNSNKKQVNPNIIKDLELVQTVDDASNNSIYHYFFNILPIEDKKKEFASTLLKQTAEYYTTDIEFLKDNQQLLKDYQVFSSIDLYKDSSNDFEKIKELWNEIKQDTGFKEKYYYIDWPIWEFLNKSENFLQCMSIYNMASPVITLLLPIIMLIIPFFIIQLKGLHLTVEEYMQVLKIILSQHVLGKFFNDFNEVSLNQKFYLLVSATFYLFSIYQNILVCIRFHQNMKKIHDYFAEINAYLNYTIDSMDHYLSYSKNLKTHQEFICVLEEKKEALKDLKNKLSFVSEYKFSITKVLEIGTILKYFYEIYDNSHLEAAFLYSFGFHGYIDCIEGIKENLESKQLNFIKFSKKKTVLKKNYYAALKDVKPIKNTVNLTKNIIITGPNASGKTTVLKSALINILLSQQFGCGFYCDGSILKPFDYIHCYLNIPDTSGRDSLFQAEARRCKEIIDFIHHRDKKESHFCVFDELYSGTNPEEAESSAISFMNYLVKKRNVTTILTTHYMKVCKELEANDTISNYHMKVNFHDKNDFQYTYLLSEGISKTKGGIKVLKDMNYPKEILETISQSFVNSKN